MDIASIMGTGNYVFTGLVDYAGEYGNVEIGNISVILGENFEENANSFIDLFGLCSITLCSISVCRFDF